LLCCLNYLPNQKITPMPNENIENPTPEISPAEPVENPSDPLSQGGGTSPIPEPINLPAETTAGKPEPTPEPINPSDPLQPTDANALAGPPVGEAGKPDPLQQGGGTSPIPEPFSTPSAENPPTLFAERGQISQGNPPLPSASASLQRDGPLPKGGEIMLSPIKNLLLKAKEMIQFRKRKKLEKILELARGKGKITNNEPMAKIPLTPFDKRGNNDINPCQTPKTAN